MAEPGIGLQQGSTYPD